MAERPSSTRREFIATCGSCALLGSAAVGLLSGCAVDLLQADIAIQLSDFPELAQEDATVLFDAGLRQPLAITRTGPGEADFIVLGTECNHLNCGVNRNGEGYLCPCHGSKFSFDGKLQEGPASADLPSYAFEVVDGTMTLLA